MRKRTITTLVLAPAGLIAASGCVSQDKYDQLNTAFRAQEHQLLQSQQEVDNLSNDNKALRTQLADAHQNFDSARNRNEQLSGELDRLAGDFQQLQVEVGTLATGPLPSDLNRMLAELAAANPGVVSFDQQQGMLRFSSDVTFDLGSAALSTEADTTIDTLATILESPEGEAFEICIVGHTDNVPIGRPETRRNHPTNMHLSAHRAISVQEALVDSGVTAPRIMVAGFGQFRPLVPNDKKGSAENRRVEIYLQPSRWAMNEAPEEAFVTPSEDDGAYDDEPMK